MHTAQDVAKWILSYNQKKMAENLDAVEPISNLKLQKLLYYIQGSSLGIFGKKMFEDDLLAWGHGPVVEVVYHQYKSNGANGIQEFLSPEEVYTEDEINIMKEVYRIFGKYSAWGLRNLTHEERPWQETALGEVIDSDLIKDYFLENYVTND